jgi:hypothetical protein
MVMRRLADPELLLQHFSQPFRLEVASDELGWRAKGVLDLGRNRALEP